MSKNSPSTPSHTPENLERVTGIGPKTAEALAHIGVHQLEDLARSTPKELATSLFEQVGLRVSPERIEAMNWIGQAQALLQQRHDTQASPPPVTASNEKPADVATAEGAAGKVQWRQYAGFSLFFDYEPGDADRQNSQTRIYHEETGDEMLFAGVAWQPWLDWILQKARLPATEGAGFASYMPPNVIEAAPGRSADLAILDVEVAARPLIGADADQRFSAKISFKVTDPYSEALDAASFPYQVMILALDLNHKQTMLLASDEGMLPTQRAVHLHELEFPILDLGRYELLTIVVVKGQCELVADYRGPIINIEP